MPSATPSPCCCSAARPTSPWRSPGGTPSGGSCGSCSRLGRPSRRTESAAELTALGCAVTEVDLEARDPGSHAATIDAAFAGRRHRHRRGGLRVARRPGAGLDRPRRGPRAGRGQLHRAGAPRGAAGRTGCGPRGTARSWRCRAWPASGSAARTSSTAPPRPARRVLPRARRGAARQRRRCARGPPRFRALQDDRGPGRGAAGRHPGGGGRGGGVGGRSTARS